MKTYLKGFGVRGSGFGTKLPLPLRERVRVRVRGPILNLGIIFALTFNFQLSTLNVYAAPGRNSVNYLKVDVGPKAVAMAGTQFGSENDPFAQFYNPALLAGITQKEFGFMHSEMIDDLRQELFAFVNPTNARGNFAFGLNYFTYGKIAGYSADGTPTGDLSARDLMLGSSWAKKWDLAVREKKIENISTGVSLKILSKKLDADSALGLALDFGAAYPFEAQILKGLETAFSIQNLGTGLKAQSDSSPLPRTIRLGLRYSWWGEAMTANLDQVLPAGEAPYPALGIEYRIRKMFSIRMGYKGAKSLDQKLSYGFGFENPLIRLDYAFVPFGDLGETHRISAVYRFGRSSKRASADDQLNEKMREAMGLYSQGLLVDAFVISFQIQRVAPWLEENNKLLNKIQKDFRELEESDKKEKLIQQAQSLFSRAEQFFEAGNLLEARTEFQAVLALQPDNKAAQGYLNHIEGQFLSFIESFYRAGMIAFAEENYEKAKEQFEKVLAIKPDHAESKAQLAKCVEMLEAKQTKEKDALQKNLEEMTFANALEAFKKDNFEEAVQLFGDVLKTAPKHEEAQRYFELCKDAIYKNSLASGREMASKQNWEPAIRHLKKAVDINPSREAKSALEDAQRRWGVQKRVLSQTLYKEGLEAFLSGDKVKAQAAWKRAIDLDPDNEEARRGLQRLSQ